jgi:hypothetical protein
MAKAAAGNTTGADPAAGKPETVADRPAPSEVVSVRIRGDEFQQLYLLAEGQGEPVSALVKRAVADWLGGNQAVLVTPPSVDGIASGAWMTTVRHSYYGSTTEIEVPDVPPPTVQGSYTTSS